MSSLTTQQLTNLRTPRQRSRLYLSIFEPQTAWNGNTTDTQQGSRELDVTTLTGDVDNIKEGYTLYVGTSIGGKEIGRVRVKSAATGTINVSENSIQWGHDYELTAVRVYEIWPVFPRVEADGENLTIWQDYDIEYTDQNANLDPVPVMGCGVARKLVNGEARVYYDGSDSWSPEGATITDYYWEFEDGDPASGTTATPEWVTYDRAGFWWTSLRVTDSNGKSYTGYRPVIIHDETELHNPTENFVLTNLSGRWDSYGWEAEVEIREDVDEDKLVDRAWICIWHESWYGSNRMEIGDLTDREEVLFTGWIDGESVTRNPDTGFITFTAKGVVPWLEGMTNYPVTLNDEPNPTGFWEMPDLDVDRAVWYYLRWNTTALRVADFYPSEDDRKAKYLDFEEGSVADAINSLIDQKGIFARLVSDHYSRMHIEVDTQLASGTVSSIFSLTDLDWRDELVISRQHRQPLSWCELSGVHYGGTGTTPNAVIVKWPGEVPREEGSPSTITNLICYPSGTMAAVAGFYAARENNEYPEVQIPMAGNWSGVFDIIPQEAITVSLGGGETKRGYVWDDRQVIVREVMHEWNPDASVLLTTVVGERYTVPDAFAGVGGDYPTDSDDAGVDGDGGGGGGGGGFGTLAFTGVRGYTWHVNSADMAAGTLAAQIAIIASQNFSKVFYRHTGCHVIVQVNVNGNSIGNGEIIPELTSASFSISGSGGTGGTLTIELQAPAAGITQGNLTLVVV